MWSKRIFALIAALLTATMLTACGSSSAGPTSAASTWVVGGIASCSGAQASSLGGVCKAMEAWAQSVNDAGGINGHRIKLIMKDDSLNPTTSGTLVRELVEKDHVIAIVGDSSNVSATWASYVDAKGVPMVGGLATESPFITDPNFFSIGANPIVTSYAVMQELKQHGYDKLGLLYCAESPACSQVVNMFGAAGQLTGVSVVSAKVAGSVPDYTAQCLQMKNSGVQALLVASGSEIVRRVLGACVAQGIDAKLVGVDAAISQSWLKDRNTEGMFGVDLAAAWFSTQLPAIKQYNDAMAKYAPDVYYSDQFGPATTYAWTAGKLFEAAAKAGNFGDNPTSADVKRGLYALKGETLGGLTAPLTYTEGRPTDVPCYFTVGIQQGQFVAPGGTTPVCLPQEKLTALMGTIGR